MTTHRLTRSLATGAAFTVVVGLASAQEPGDRGTSSVLQRERTPLATTFPEYPQEAHRDRLEGETTVCFTVNSRGEVVRPSVRSSTHKIFEKPSIKAIRASTFEPLGADEIPSVSESCRVYRFNLDALPSPLESLEPQPTLAASTASAPVSAAALLPFVATQQSDALPGHTAAAPTPEGGAAEGSIAVADAASTPEGEALEGDALQEIVVTGEPLCQPRRRPGSRIAEMTCFAPEDLRALELAKINVTRDFQRETDYINQEIQRAQMENEAPNIKF